MAKLSMTIKNNVIKTIIIIPIMVSVFFILSIIPNNIPSGKIKDNTVKSVNIIEKDNLKYTEKFLIFRLDNFTDALMLDMAYNVNSDTPVKSSMENIYYIEKKDQVISATEINNLIISATKKILNDNYKNIYPVNYTRYWHGYLLFLRPLLVFIDYGGIRIVNYVLLSLMFICLCILILKKCGWLLFSVFCASAAIFNLWMIPLSMQYSATFYISLSASTILLARIKKNGNGHYKHINQFFLIIGGTTSFFDLLTTPLLTLGLPLIFYMSTSAKSIKEKYLAVFSCSATWLLGYSTIWISKWLIAHLIIGYDINDAISSVIFRTSTKYDDFDMSFYGIFRFLTDYPVILTAAVLFMIIFISLNIFLYRKNRKVFINNSHLLLIAAMPFIWCIILRNHSIIHCWFVWRIFFISMISYLLFVAEFIQPKSRNRTIREQCDERILSTKL